ncbi:MAG: general secretion pathway protein GspK [Desulfovibrio sp.]|nr:general secretion pathway protein GspK [Desulfovibrio sp.]
MSGKSRASEDGAVLIIVLFLMAGIAALSLDLGRDALLDSAFSRSIRARLASKPLLASCENLAARFIVRDFQNAPEVPESMNAKNRRLAVWLEDYADHLKSADIEIRIEDENGRFPLRALFPNTKSEKIRAEQYEAMLERIVARLLVARGYEKGEDNARIAARRYVAELLAWGGEKPVSEEATRWYLDREIPYLPPGRPPESLAELPLVYWPDVDEELAKKVLLGDSDGPGLLENCSLWSRGPINVNSITTVTGWGLADDLATARSFMNELETARAALGDELPRGWENDVFSARGLVRPPSSILSDQSRWFRIKATVRQGAAKNSVESVGWITKTRMTWIRRHVL